MICTYVQLGIEWLLSWGINQNSIFHYNDIIMSVMASQITSLTIVYSSVYSGADQRKHQSSTSLAFAQELHRWPVNSPHKGPVTRKMFPFDNVIMLLSYRFDSYFQPHLRYNPVSVLVRGILILSSTNQFPYAHGMQQYIWCQCQNLRKIFTDPMYESLLSFTVISDVYRSFIPTLNCTSLISWEHTQNDLCHIRQNY